MKLALAAALVVPLSFWDRFMDAIPRGIIETPYFSHHRVVVMPKAFTPQHLETMAREFAKASAAAPLAILYLAPSYDNLSLYNPTEAGFDNWRYRLERDLKSRAEPIKDIAQVNVVNGEAVLRLRKNGRVSRHVLTERDPLKYVIDGQDFEVLEIYGRLSGTEVKREYLDGCMLSVNTCKDCISYFHVAVRTAGELRMPAFQELVRQLARIPVPANLMVSLRQDSWFVPSGWFPFLYAFDERTSRLPSKKEYESAKELGALVNRKAKRIYYGEHVRREWIERGSERIIEE